MRSDEEMASFFEPYRDVLEAFVAEKTRLIDHLHETSPQFNPAKRHFIAKAASSLSSLFKGIVSTGRVIFHGSDYGDDKAYYQLRWPYFTIRQSTVEEGCVDISSIGKPPSLKLRAYYCLQLKTPELMRLSLDDKTGGVNIDFNYDCKFRPLSRPEDLAPILQAWFRDIAPEYVSRAAPLPPSVKSQPV